MDGKCGRQQPGVRRSAPRGGWPARCDDETLFETRGFIHRVGALLVGAMTLS